jgi:hypothetical protein
LGEPIGRCRQRDAIRAEQAISKVISTTCSMKASTKSSVITRWYVGTEFLARSSPTPTVVISISGKAGDGAPAVAGPGSVERVPPGCGARVELRCASAAIFQRMGAGA